MITKKYHHLATCERDLIAVWKGAGLSLRIIAKKLDRSVSSISEEINRNQFYGHYVAIHAQAESEQRKIKARKRHPLKDPLTYAYVLEKLRDGWSPEQIAGRLEKESGKKVISYETIYRFIYSPINKPKRLWGYLPWKRTKRKQKLNRGVKRLRIPNRVSIHQRPAIIDQRQEFGHWEADTMVGKQEKGKVIHTEVERKSRWLKALLINSRKAEETIGIQKKIFRQLICKSITSDNGLEFVKHTELNKELKIKTYFADPYSAWQRGTNEYHNGLLRRYLPKKTSFVDLTQEELNDMVEEINNRPRKILQYQTPEEVFNSYLGVRVTG